MFWKQLYLLLWKNFILRKRHWLRTLIEILWPLFLFAILVAIRKSQVVETKTECHYPARAMPSAGVYPWMKSLLCDLQNPCFSVQVPSEVPGQINDPSAANQSSNVGDTLNSLLSLLNANTSILTNFSQITEDLQSLSNLTQLIDNNTVPVSSLLVNQTAYDEFLIGNLSLSQPVADSIVSSNVTAAQAVALPGLLGQRAIVCNDTLLSAGLTIPGDASLVSSELCNLTDAQLVLLSLFTTQSYVPAATLLSLFQTGPLTAAQLSSLTNLAGYGSELQALQAPLSEIAQSQQPGSTSLFSSLLGFDLSSPTGVRDFCGHPAETITGLSLLLSNETLGASLFNTSSNNFCDELFANFENDDQYSFFWDTIKPLILGKILYSPDSPLIQSIIAQANSTFETIGFVQSFGESWQTSAGPTLYQELESGATVSALRAALSSTTNLELLAATLNVPVSTVVLLNTFLSNDDNPNDLVITWKDLYRQLDAAITSVTKLLGCFELDKFRGYGNEDLMVDEALAQLENNTLWGSIVFVTPTASDVALPKIVKYKIRQDAGSVTRTTVIQNFFWRPGAEDGTMNVKYYGNGYVHIQDMIEHAIVQVSSGGSSSSSGTESNLTLGKYLQEMPYPCYTRDSDWSPEANADYSSNDMAYYFGGFLFLQDIIDHGIIDQMQANHSPSTDLPLSSNYVGAYLQEFPYPCYTYDEFLEYLSSMLSLLMTLAWIYSVCIIIKNIVYEKEQRLKEVMKMMGLSNGVHWVAWFINSFVVMFCSILLLIILLKVGAVTPFSNMFIVLLWLSSFAIATIAQCFLISCFFTRANLAAACGGIIYFVLYIPYNMAYAFRDEMTLSTKLVACLLSTVAFGYGSAYISQYEMAGDGIQFDNWNSSPDPNDQLTFLISMLMMLLDALIYMTLTWYIENVFPGTYGVPRPWYFFATRSYWCGGGKKRRKTAPASIDVDYYQEQGLQLEAEPADLPLGVSIRNLKKVYDNGKVAVDDLSLNFYEGQITSFLGHNGAGKTTTMSMLTGLFTPTSGSAHIYGNDIQSEMDEIRHQLGFCPQHNVLFGDLTVLEHLRFYSGLKNAAGGNKESHQEIEAMVNDVGLPHKKNDISRHLSGGMKRKLSVAVAFVGGSKCVILDEPTAGVDPYARRGIWDLLLRYRTNRTILLSTHHMDEADLLGDRIAIISHGKLQCCGSSLFLKSSFGVGYYLTIVKKTDQEKNSNNMLKQQDAITKISDEGFESNFDNSSVKPSSSRSSATPSPYPGSDAASGDASNISEKESSLVSSVAQPAIITEKDKGPSELNDVVPDFVQSSHVINLVRKTIPKSKLHEENPRETTFVLPYSAQASGKFSELFRKLDECDVTYGLTDTSLEEIFLSVAEQDKSEGKEEKSTCCFCIPRRKQQVVSQLPELEGQARFSRTRRSTMRSIHSELYARSTSPLVEKETFNDFDDDIFESEADDGSKGQGSYKVEGKKLVWQQFKALFVKRFHHARRNTKGIIAQIIVPAGFVALALLFALIVPQVKSFPPLELQPWMYGDTNTFYSDDLPNSSLSSGVSQSLLDSPTLGMRCVTGYQLLNENGTLLSCEHQQNGPWQDHTEIAGFSQDVSSNQTLTCACTDKETRVLLAECPVGAGGSATPRVLTQSSDWMYNMTGRNLSDWLVKTVDQFIRTRFGGLSLGEVYYRGFSAAQIQPVIEFVEANSNFSLANASNNQTVNRFVENLARSENAKVWFDNNGFHSMPTWLNILSNAALRSSLPPGENPMEYGIAAINHPLEFTKSTVDLAALSQSITDTLISISVIFALSFIPASFVIFLIEEKVTKAKHLQFVSGVNQFVYWISTFLWDMVNYIIPIIIVLLIFLCFQTKAYVSPDNFPCLVSLLLLYGFSITPMMYPASFYFEVPSTAYVVLTCVNLFIGINTSIATFILELLDDPILTEVNSYLVQVFLIFPQYCLGRGLIDMALNQAYADAYASFGIDNYVNPFTFTLVGKNLMAMAIEGVGFFVITVLIQYRFFVKPRKVVTHSHDQPFDLTEHDEDVVAERKRLIGGNSDDILQLNNLTKVFRKQGANTNLIAVDRLCFGVPKGECFGLLGVNGAGKTTTFKMLTGDETPTAGDASICGRSILGDLREVQQNTGYCPQFEALNSLLTGREHLIFYAKLRGVPPEDTDRVADWAINKFGLKIYANKPAGTYSGGNKRKLSAAIAFIGCPPVVFLDEPTAGMDPMSRRFLWSRISEAVRGGRCIVLTSHSMEECEALCSRLAIMVNGQLKCLGSPQHLKNKYGEGYTITIKVAGSDSDLEAVNEFITSSFADATLKEHHCNTLMYQLPSERVRLTYLFDTLESNKERMRIEDYSVSQTTLDEVFVSFAKNQTDGLEEQEMQPDPVSVDAPDGISMNELVLGGPPPSSRENLIS